MLVSFLVPRLMVVLLLDILFVDSPSLALSLSMLIVIYLPKYLDCTRVMSREKTNVPMNVYML